MSLLDFILGLFPGTTTTKEDLASLNDMRLKKYRRNWNAYWGIDLDRMASDDGSPPARVNFLKRNIDKIGHFAFGQGYEMTHPRYSQHLRIADRCWGTRKIEKLRKLAQQGSVTGDAFVMVAPKSQAAAIAKNSKVKTVESTENTLGSQVAIVIVPSEYCLPYYDPFDSDLLIAVEIKIPFQMADAAGRLVTHYQYMRITDDTVSTGVVDGEGNAYGISMTEPTGSLATVANPIKSVYVVHIRNFPAGNSIFGSDDITEAAPLNKEYTERLTDVGQIVAYHSAPITCVYGARAGNLVRGPNKIWGNLPKDAKVENLGLDTDLKAANDHLQRIKEGLHEITGVPEIAQGSQQAISNTSGVALHTMYLPLIERAETKQTLYTPGLIEVMILAIKWAQALNLLSMVDPSTGAIIKPDPITKPEAWDDLRFNTETFYPSPLPKDRLIEAQVQATLLQNKLQSRRGAMVSLGVKDPDLLMEQIEEEDEEAAEHEAELMKKTGMTKDGKPVPPPTGGGDDGEKGGNGSSDANGNERVDEGGSGVNSGAGATQGVQRTESGEPRGRPRT